MTIRSITRCTVVTLSALMITAGGMQVANADEAEATNTGSSTSTSSQAEADTTVTPGMTPEEMRAATENDPQAHDAVESVLKTNTGSSSSSDSTIDPSTLTAERGDSTEKQKFWTPALAVGCGVSTLPFTGSFATLQPGPNYGAGPLIGRSNLIQPYIPHGHVFFHIFTLDEKLAPAVDGTTVSVAWFNLRTGRGGVEQLDDTVLGAGINSQTSKLVYTGEGPVIAAVAGKVAYRGGETCTILPIVGSTTVN